MDGAAQPAGRAGPGQAPPAGAGHHLRGVQGPAGGGRACRPTSWTCSSSGRFCVERGQAGRFIIGHGLDERARPAAPPGRRHRPGPASPGHADADDRRDDPAAPRPTATPSSRSTGTPAPTSATTSRTWRRAGTTSSTPGPPRTSTRSPTCWRRPRTATGTATRRLDETESHGIVAEVLFPNTVPPFFARGQPHRAAADAPRTTSAAGPACRRTTAGSPTSAPPRPGRRAGVAQVFLNDLDDALAEVRWAHEHMRRLRRHPAARRPAELAAAAAVGPPLRAALGPLRRARRAASTSTAAAGCPTSASTRRRGRSCSSRSPGSRTARCGT